MSDNKVPSLDDMLELDNFTITLSEDGQWANYVFPCYRGRKHFLGFHRGSRQLAWGKRWVSSRVVNRVLREEGVIG